MITARMKEGSTWMGQHIRFETTLFGRNYFWMEDGDGTTYLAKIDENGYPDLS